jgi:hypothetical protein
MTDNLITAERKQLELAKIGKAALHSALWTCQVHQVTAKQYVTELSNRLGLFEDTEGDPVLEALVQDWIDDLKFSEEGNRVLDTFHQYLRLSLLGERYFKDKVYLSEKPTAIRFETAGNRSYLHLTNLLWNGNQATRFFG